MESTGEIDAKIWLREHYPLLVEKRAPQITYLPDLREFQSEWAKKSLSPWSGWEAVADDLEALSQSPEESDDEILDNFLAFLETSSEYVGNTDPRLLSDENLSLLNQYEFADGHRWVVSFPALSYILLWDRLFVRFAVKWEHPNLSLMVAEVPLIGTTREEAQEEERLRKEKRAVLREYIMEAKRQNASNKTDRKSKEELLEIKRAQKHEMLAKRKEEARIKRKERQKEDRLVISLKKPPTPLSSLNRLTLGQYAINQSTLETLWHDLTPTILATVVEKDVPLTSSTLDFFNNHGFFGPENFVLLSQQLRWQLLNLPITMQSDKVLIKLISLLNNPVSRFIDILNANRDIEIILEIINRFKIDLSTVWYNINQSIDNNSISPQILLELNRVAPWIDEIDDKSERLYLRKLIDHNDVTLLDTYVTMGLDPNISVDIYGANYEKLLIGSLAYSILTDRLEIFLYLLHNYDTTPRSLFFYTIKTLNMANETKIELLKKNTILQYLLETYKYSKEDIIKALLRPSNPIDMQLAEALGIEPFDEEEEPLVRLKRDDD